MLCIIHAKHDSEDKQTGYWQFGCSSCMRNKIAALRGECEKQRLLLNEAVVKLADCYEDYKKYRKASEEKDTRIAELKAALRDIAQIDKRPLGRYANGRSRGYEEYSTLSQQEMAKIAAAALKGDAE